MGHLVYYFVIWLCLWQRTADGFTGENFTRKTWQRALTFDQELSDDLTHFIIQGKLQIDIQGRSKTIVNRLLYLPLPGRAKSEVKFAEYMSVIT